MEHSENVPAGTFPRYNFEQNVLSKSLNSIVPGTLNIDRLMIIHKKTINLTRVCFIKIGHSELICMFIIFYFI
jgi:hypothetical protein